MHPTIEIVPDDPTWPAAFGREADRVRDALGDVALRLDHVGSTGVPGLAAKPIVDMQLSVAVIQPMEASRGPLAHLGYTFVHDPEFEDYPFFHWPGMWPHAYHIHVCEGGTPLERRHLAFRDYLRAHPDVADEYAALKRRLAPRYRADRSDERNAYADAKTPFIAEVQRRALLECAGE